VDIHDPDALANISNHFKISQITNTNIYDEVQGGTSFPMTVKSIEKTWQLENDDDGSVNAVGTQPYLTTTTKTWFDGYNTSSDIPALPGDLSTYNPPESIHYGNVTQTEIIFSDGTETFSE